jgi:hypothetical protein
LHYFANSALHFTEFFVTLHAFKNKSSYLGINPIIMRQTKIEQLLGITVSTRLIGGILFMALLCKGIWESGQDMASPDYVLIFARLLAAAVMGSSVLKPVMSLSGRGIENELKQSKKRLLFHVR